jgi:hypothetical protein
VPVGKQVLPVHDRKTPKTEGRKKLYGGVFYMLFPMMFGISAVIFIIGYIVYGRFMANVYGLSDTNETPAVKFEDGCCCLSD